MTYLVYLIEQYGLAAVFINVFLGQLGAPVPSYTGPSRDAMTSPRAVRVNTNLDYPWYGRQIPA